MSNRHFNPIIVAVLILMFGWALTLEIMPLPVWKQMEMQGIKPQITSVPPDGAARIVAFIVIGYAHK